MTSSNDDKTNPPDNTKTPRRRRVRRSKTLPGVTDRRERSDSSESGYDDMLNNIPTELPVLPLRDVAVFNYMIVPLLVGRETSAHAVEAAAQGSRHLFLCTQKDEAVEDPTQEDLFEVGSVAVIMRLLKMPDGHLKALVQGLARARMVTLHTEGEFLTADIELLQELPIRTPEAEQEALVRFAREQCERILAMRGIPTAEIMNVLSSVNEPGRIADLIAANLRLKLEEAQEILACLDPMERLHMVVANLVREAEVAAMQVKIQTSAREGMDKAQREYFLREQLKAIRRELGEGSDSEEELEILSKALDDAQLPEEARKEADKQLRRLATMHGDSAEASVARTYLDWLAELPWSVLSEDQLDIIKAHDVLDEDHYGLKKIKERILEYLSVRKLNPDSKGSILCFAGPPGVGKTSLGRSIARSLDRKFQRISLGGMRDEAEIRGHRRTYIGAMPGRIIQALKQAGTRNPVIMLDELDKLGADFRGDPSSALLEALDPEQNVNFSDHYLNVPFDLSKVLFVCTANHLENIPGPLRDRLEIINLSGYTAQEKLAIAKTYLIPRQQKENGLEGDEVQLPDNVLERIIREYTREAGLRNLEREIGAVFRKLARRKAEGKKPPYRVVNSGLSKLLGIPRYPQEDRESELPPGVALGLAWTVAGGEVLQVEAVSAKGKGGLNLTGKLGDVMKESAQAAMSYAKAHAGALNLPEDFPDNLDIHIHVPDGATPKDGPSAGVTMLTALLSLLTNRSVRSDLCMTGEISLQGRVLPVGGIKEKILAGVAYGLKHAFIPAKNAKDLEDIPQELRKKIQIHTAAHVQEIIDFALLTEDIKK